MADGPVQNELMFEVATPIGFSVHVTRAHWEVIVTVKHPAMAGRESDVIETLANPDEVRLSRTDPHVYLFYRAERGRRWDGGD